jgi:TfoX/Sxy family transcriptional regulator of competence genes
VAYDDGLLQRCLDTVDALAVGAVRHKNVFGMRGLMWHDRMFAAVGESSIIVKLQPQQLSAALALPGVRSFSPGGQKLGSWVEVDADAVADDPELREWLERGLATLR